MTLLFFDVMNLEYEESDWENWSEDEDPRINRPKPNSEEVDETTNNTFDWIRKEPIVKG
jgi:hypothetical protein